MSVSSAEAVGVALTSFTCYRAELICCRSRPITLCLSALLFVDKRDERTTPGELGYTPLLDQGMW